MSQRRFAEVDGGGVITRCFWDEELSQVGAQGVQPADNSVLFVEGANYAAAAAALQSESDRVSALNAACKDDTVVLAGTTIGQLRAMTIAQLNTWFNTNVTDLASARTVLKAVFILVVRKLL